MPRKRALNSTDRQAKVSAQVRQTFKLVRQRLSSNTTRPALSYRIQLNKDCGFKEAARIIPYLHRLGVTHLYCSPYLKARPGSTHGYDIIDHNSLNTEIGSEEDFKHMVEVLHSHGMKQIFDFVPNHMSIVENPWWNDILEHGPGSPYAGYFDINWEPPKKELWHKVLLPILADRYGKVLGKGEIRLHLSGGKLWVTYTTTSLPLDPGSYSAVLEAVLQREGIPEGQRSELGGVLETCKGLPPRDDLQPEQVGERRRIAPVIKADLERVIGNSQDVRQALEATIAEFNGIPGNAESFDRLHSLLERQAYRLSFWGVAADEINYRRFFYINELVALRQEDPEVFTMTHRRVRDLLSRGAVDGIRIDHIDGLCDPVGYLWRLQRAYFVDLCRSMAKEGVPPADASDKMDAEQEWDILFHQEVRDGGTGHHRPLFLLVEKILGKSELICRDWPVEGTTGYEFGALLNGLFIARGNRGEMENIYRKFTGAQANPADVIYSSKHDIASTSLAGEVDALAQSLSDIASLDRDFRDFTCNSLRSPIKAVLSSFPVYRIYVNCSEDRVEPHDQEQVLKAVKEARKREPALSREAFDYLRDVLLLKYPGSRGENSRSRQRSFVMRFQQVSSAVMAKGMEDTAFYRYFPLISVNEVGGTMGDFGCSVSDFHDANKRRLSDQPFSMISTATHDSKRGEDVRARINVLSEIPGEWQDTLERWGEINKQAKTLVDGEMMPDANTEYLVYQMLLGTYVLQMDQVDADNYERRIKEYIAKAAREANRHTNWVNPNQRYEQALFSFVSALLRRSPDNLFLADFLPLARLISVCGIYNSLSQLTLKIFSPGNPDFYQGTELWDCSLVDPDNRRPVNFDKRAELLARLEERAASASGPGSLIAELVGGMGSGMIKLFVTWKGLDFRRRHGALFYSGSYRPLAAEGQAKDNICAFSWLGESKELIICVPRLVERIVGERLEPVVGAPFWSGTHLLLGDSPGAGSFSNIFTGESIQCGLDSASVSISDLFKSFPVAALVRPH